MRRYQWQVIQLGGLPLRPDGSYDGQIPYCCTSVMVWPDGAAPSPQNTILTDPCLIGPDYYASIKTLDEIGHHISNIGHYFVTHPHYDHLPAFAIPDRPLNGKPFFPTDDSFRLIHCPGHHAMLRALAFQNGENRQVWIVGDAVLDETWLRAWGYYWPNGYSPAEIVQTWRSVAQICTEADVIIPGHGEAIIVNQDLLQNLINAFPQASHAADCPDVREILATRLSKFK